MLARVAELRLVFSLVAGGLLVFLSRGSHFDAPADFPPSSRQAIEQAHALAASIEELRYDDPRLAPTRGFAMPDHSLAPVSSGLRSLWKIVEHEPAPYMKTIEIRVRWSHAGDRREVAVTSVKAS